MIDLETLVKTVQNGIATCECTPEPFDPECRGCAADVALRSLVAHCEETEKALDLERGSYGGPGYMDWSQKWVDQVCHYRNLAIALGAKPEDMLDKYDRELAKKGLSDQNDQDGADDYAQKNEQAEPFLSAHPVTVPHERSQPRQPPVLPMSRAPLFFIEDGDTTAAQLELYALQRALAHPEANSE